MNQSRSSLPLSLLLLLFMGLAVVRWRMDHPGRHASPGNRPDPREASESMGFGPIPLVGHSEISAPNAADPDPGPVSDAMRKLASVMSRRSDDLTVVAHPDGRRSVDLEGRFQLMSAAVTGADGKPEVRCFSSYQEMAAALSASRPLATAHPPGHDR